MKTVNPKTETRILAAYGAARALADVVDGRSTLVVEICPRASATTRLIVECRALRFGTTVMWWAPLDPGGREWERLAMVIEDVLDMLKVTVRS